MRVARFDCRDSQTTISRLPDFAAARKASAGLDGGQGGKGEPDYEIPQPVWTAVKYRLGHRVIDRFHGVSSVVDAT